MHNGKEYTKVRNPKGVSEVTKISRVYPKMYLLSDFLPNHPN